MPYSNNEKDDFWDIEKLLPKKAKASSDVQSHLSSYNEVSTAAHTVPGESFADRSELKLTSMPEAKPHTAYEFSYIPDNRFIERVTVKSFPDRYDFYGNFRKAALVYFDFKAPRCDFVPYYSYMPQYTQFTSAQKAFYFYWRGEVRRGNYIPTDYSYLYLYVYEILNLPDKIEAKEGLRMLCDVWCAYRKTLPKIDERFLVWIRDFCLINRLSAPIEKIGGFIFDIIGGMELCEFYLSGFDSLGRVPTDIMIAYLSDYDWRRGKYAGGETEKTYAALMKGALDSLMSHLWLSGKIGSGICEPKTVELTAFPNTLCTHDVKKYITVEYYPIYAAPYLRDSITMSVRYTENKLRALIGIKSRLAVKNLDGKYKAIIDGYFASVIEKEAKVKRKSDTPEYEGLYDARDLSVSQSDAEAIELASWSTTARLVTEDESEIIKTENVAKVNEHVFEAEASANTLGLSARDIDALMRLLSGKYITDGAAAERINNAFLDFIGDVALESDGENYTLIEDYKEDVSEWLKSMEK